MSWFEALVAEFTRSLHIVRGCLLAFVVTLLPERDAVLMDGLETALPYECDVASVRGREAP